MAFNSPEVRAQEVESAIRRIPTNSTTVLAITGICERGPVGSSPLTTSFEEWKSIYGGLTADTLDTYAAVQGYYDNGGVYVRTSRAVHVTSVGDPSTKTSAAATLDLLSAVASATSGTVSSAAGPWLLAHGDTLIVAFESGGNQTFTISAVAASRTSTTGTYVLTNGMTLQIAVNSGATKTKTFGTAEFVDIGAATPAEVVASLNAFFLANAMDVLATVSANAVKLTSGILGTGGSVNVVGGTANTPLLFTTGSTPGTGNVANANRTGVTAAEWVTIMSAITNGTATAVSGALKLTSATTGLSSTAQVISTSTADDEMSFDNASHAGTAGTAVTVMTLDGKTDGTYANSITPVIATATSGLATEFNFSLVKNGITLERRDNLSIDTAAPNYFVSVLNDVNTGSRYVTVTDAGNDLLPATGTLGPMAGGADGLGSITDTDFSGGLVDGGATGLYVFDQLDVDILICPDRATAAMHNSMITYCEIHRDGKVFAVLDPPAGQTGAQMVTYVRDTAAIKGLSEFAAIYWPRVQVVNPDKTLFGANANVTIPPSGHIAGVYARVDGRKIGGAFDAPAGTDGIYRPRNVIGLETTEVNSKAIRDLIVPEFINPIHSADSPLYIDGSRTLRQDGNFPSIPQRRGVIFIEKQLIAGLLFLKHRGITTIWLKAGERTTFLFMLEITRAKALASEDPKKAFWVDFGKGLNTAATAQTATFYGGIGIATARPGEFVVLLISPDTRALDAELAALSAAA